MRVKSVIIEKTGYSATREFEIIREGRILEDASCLKNVLHKGVI